MRDTGREVRLLLDVDGKIYQLAKFIIRNQDASLYIVPYSVNRVFKGLLFNLGNGIGPFETTVDVSEAEESAGPSIPHLSLHASGIVHAYEKKGDKHFGELQAQPLAGLINQHVATLSINSIESLPVFDGEPDIDRKKSKFDAVVKIVGKVRSPRFPIIVNSQKIPFMNRCLLEVGIPRRAAKVSGSLRLPPLPPIRYCVEYRDDTRVDELAKEAFVGSGVVIIAGWDVFKLDKGELTKFLVLHGQ